MAMALLTLLCVSVDPGVGAGDGAREGAAAGQGPAVLAPGARRLPLLPLRAGSYQCKHTTLCPAHFHCIGRPLWNHLLICSMPARSGG